MSNASLVSRSCEGPQQQLLSPNYLEDCMSSSTCILHLAPSSCFSLCSWANQAFQRVFGWRFEEIVGVEMFFLHGDAANMIPLARRMKEVEEKSIGFECDQQCYTRSGILVSCVISVTPVFEDKVKQLSFVEMRFSNVVEISFPESIANRSFEIGLPIDRRDYCKTYSSYYGQAVAKNNISSVSHFQKFCRHASMTNVLSLMMATSSLILICNSRGEILIASSKFCSIFGVQSMSPQEQLIGKNILSWLSESRLSTSICEQFTRALKSINPSLVVPQRTVSFPASFAVKSVPQGFAFNMEGQGSCERSWLHSPTTVPETTSCEDSCTLRLHTRSSLSQQVLASINTNTSDGGLYDSSPITVAYIRASPILAPGSPTTPGRKGTSNKAERPFKSFSMPSCAFSGTLSPVSLPDISKIAFDLQHCGDSNTNSIEEAASLKSLEDDGFHCTKPDTMATKKRKVSIGFWSELNVSSSIEAVTSSCVGAFKAISERITDNTRNSSSCPSTSAVSIAGKGLCPTGEVSNDSDVTSSPEDATAGVDPMSRKDSSANIHNAAAEATDTNVQEFDAVLPTVSNKNSKFYISVRPLLSSAASKSESYKLTCILLLPQN